MFRKRCPHCGNVSYSATVSGKWICPHCNADITDQPASPEGEKEREPEETKGKQGKK